MRAPRSVRRRPKRGPSAPKAASPTAVPATKVAITSCALAMLPPSAHGSVGTTGRTRSVPARPRAVPPASKAKARPRLLMACRSRRRRGGGPARRPTGRRSRRDSREFPRAGWSGAPRCVLGRDGRYAPGRRPRGRANASLPPGAKPRRLPSAARSTGGRLGTVERRYATASRRRARRKPAPPLRPPQPRCVLATGAERRGAGGRIYRLCSAARYFSMSVACLAQPPSLAAKALARRASGICSKPDSEMVSSAPPGTSSSSKTTSVMGSLA
jgi:hypothetical protein